MSSSRKVVPKIFIESTYWYDTEHTLCHAIVICSPGTEKKVARSISSEYKKAAKKEIKGVVKKYGDCLLRKDDDDEGCAYIDDGEFEWVIDADNIEEYGVNITIGDGMILVTYNPPVYYAHYGDLCVGESYAMLESVIKAAEKHDGVSYYLYNGYYTIDTHGDNMVEEEYYSSENCIPEKDWYIGKVFHELWENSDFWEGFESIIENYIVDHGKDKAAGEIKEFLKKYGSDIGGDAMEVLRGHLKETELNTFF